jgi:L-2,4-diaminobutyrate decarboxylase
MGLLIGRNVFALKHNVDLQKSGITPTIAKFRIFCSEDAHFTVDQSAAILGLGSDSIIKIPSEYGRIKCDLLRLKIKEVRSSGDIPFCISATAGTTDFGAIDDLLELSKIAKEEQLWYHIDAAYGGGLLFVNDPQKRNLIAGIECADSIGLDFHKMLFVPIPCGVYMMKDKKNFETIRTSAVYLNPENDEVMGFQNLVYKSLLTTRRFDALKAYVALRVVGRDNYSKMIAHSTGLAKRVATHISQDTDFELAMPPTISTVVFRFCPASHEKHSEIKFWNDINYTIRNRMIERGGGVIAQTTFMNKTQLKFTILNPMIEFEDVVSVLTTIKKYGHGILAEKK